jgi:hypothetical protein
MTGSNHFSRFLLLLSAISILSVAAARIIFTLIVKPVPSGFYWPFLFFFVTTAIIYKAVTYATEKHPGRFPAYFMGATTVKLLGGLAFLVIYAVRHSEHVKPFFVLFLFLYMIFTSFEVISILNYLKGRKSHSQH